MGRLHSEQREREGEAPKKGQILHLSPDGRGRREPPRMDGVMKATTRQMRMIWALSHQRGMTEAALRKWIEAVSGQTSLRRLTTGQASQLIEGLQDKSKDVTVFCASLAERADRMTAAQQQLIEQLAGALGWSARQVTGLTQHMYGRSPRESLTRSQASGLIEALKAMGRRAA
jgi:Bacteriophage Mu, GemA protein